MYLKVELDIHVFSKSAGIVIPECSGISKSLGIQNGGWRRREGKWGRGEVQPNHHALSFKLTMLVRFLTPKAMHIVKMEEGAGCQG